MGWRAARLRMVARLLREGRIAYPRLLHAFLTTPRHLFVPPELAAAAYGPEALEIAEEQTLTCPDFVAMMTALIRPRPGHRVLEVGTGTGYQAAILAAHGAQVTSIEVLPTLHAMARAAHTRAKVRGVDLRLGDGALGAPDQAPFDGIVVACAADPIPPALLDQLAVGGRLVAPEGPADRVQTLVLIERTPTGFTREALRGAWFVPLR